MVASVIICTHNPRREYLSRTLEALRLQTLRTSEWELLLIDNASSPAVGDLLSATRRPNGRYITEEEPGLTPARLRGIAEAKGDLLVFVDDDNVLRHDYIEMASKIGAAHPHLGAFGGSIEPEFEVEPNPRFQSLLPSLAIRPVTQASWANFGLDMVPYGAGLCVRAKVAQAYAAAASASKVRRHLGRRPGSLMGGDDLDLSMTSYNLGMGVGLFGELVLTHLIDRRRMSARHLYQVCMQGNYSFNIVRYLHTGFAPQYRGIKGLIVDWFTQVVRACLGHPLGLADKAKREGERRAACHIRFLREEHNIVSSQL